MRRYDGVAGFLESRGIPLPRGEPSDPPDRDTVCGLGNRKNDAFVAQVREHGVEPFESTLVLARGLRAHRHPHRLPSRRARTAPRCSLRPALTGSSTCAWTASTWPRLGLAGKPDPALFLEAARRLGVAPAQAAVVEDALAGVEAGRRGGFGLVVGVDRTGHTDTLAAHGADVVVADLAYLEVDDEGRWSIARTVRSAAELPPALGNPELAERLVTRSLAVFSDYDGTLTPIVARPELALLADETLAVLNRLARKCLVAIISGRDLDDVRDMVRAEGVWYAGSHGMDIAAPDGARHEIEEAHRLLDVLAAAADELDAELTAVPGAWLDRKRFAFAAHTRQVDDARVPEVEAAVDDVVARHPELRRIDGKRVFEVRPDIEWDKGRALWWLFEQAGLADTVRADLPRRRPHRRGRVLAARRRRASGSWSPTRCVPSAADYRVTDTDEVRTFLTDVATLLEETDA